MSVLVAPSLLSASAMHMQRDIKSVEEAGADLHHVDVMDGHFVPNLTYGPPFVKSLKQVASIPLDVHIMVSNPDEATQWYLDAGADYLTFHIEAAKDPAAVIAQVKKSGAKAGLSLNPDTKVDKILPFLDSLDMVLIMSVHPGFGGQKFISSALDKVSKVASEKHPDLLISVDGGVNQETGEQCRQAGANTLVAGSYVYGSEDKTKAISSLRG